MTDKTVGGSSVKADTEDVETELYRHFDKDGKLLYVGISLSTGLRMSGHRAKSSWWPQVATVTIQRYPSRQEASNAEIAAIKAEKPPHNTQHTREGPMPTVYLRRPYMEGDLEAYFKKHRPAKKSKATA